MPPRVVLAITAATAVASIVLQSFLRGHSPSSPAEWLAPIGPAVSAAYLGMVAFNRYVWRWPGVSALHGRPVLRGTWRGELASQWADPESNERAEKDGAVFLVIRQTFWTVSARLLTKESSSRSIVATLRADDDGACHLEYIYVNVPRADARHHSELHYGAAILVAPRKPDEGIEGHYFTDRTTRGELRFSRRYKGLVDTYDAARSLTSQR